MIVCTPCIINLPKANLNLYLYYRQCNLDLLKWSSLSFYPTHDNKLACCCVCIYLCLCAISINVYYLSLWYMHVYMCVGMWMCAPVCVESLSLRNCQISHWNKNLLQFPKPQQSRQHDVL